MKDQFNIYSSDSQASKVLPLSPEEFDFEAYAEYEARLNQGCKKFWESSLRCNGLSPYAGKRSLCRRQCRLAEIP
jgi:hypothetical protein